MRTLHKDTLAALGGDNLRELQSRSLRLTRYARPDLDDKTQPTRHAFLKAVISPEDQRLDCGLKSWHAWLEQSLPPAPANTNNLLYAQLEARLLINMGGTVLENAGLQLDRFGTAYIPGSAVKACARRTVLATLRQWCETGINPRDDDSDTFAPTCATFNTPDALLLAILRVFGCTDLEWGAYDPAPKSPNKNDLAWACGEKWPDLRDVARLALNATSGADKSEAKPTRRGAVAFLPAYPHNRPATDLELDVLTSHHPEYYSGQLETATDTENPIPVYFPAVAAKTIYAFAILPVGKADPSLLAHARNWLMTGLEVFGLGAKTAAGYGYFTDVTDEITTEIATKQAKAAADRRRVDEEAATKAKQAAELAARKEREAARATMTPQQRADDELAAKADDWGWMKQYLGKFVQHPPEVQAALLRWFAGAGKDRWLTEIKPDAAKGKKPWSQIIGAINVAKKFHKIDLPA